MHACGHVCMRPYVFSGVDACMHIAVRVRAYMRVVVWLCMCVFVCVCV